MRRISHVEVLVDVAACIIDEGLRGLKCLFAARHNKKAPVAEAAGADKDTQARAAFTSAEP